jgi:hypothetical protein
MTSHSRKEGTGEDGSARPGEGRANGPDSVDPKGLAKPPDTGTSVVPKASPTTAPPLAIQDDTASASEERIAQQVRELMRALVRALKAKKMYPTNNPVLARIVSEFQDNIMGLLKEQDELTLSVDAVEFYYGFEKISVYKNASKRDSLAHRFNRDGITQISFAGGLTPPELNAFLDVLARATDPHGAEEDLVTILWEQEFAHIRYAYLAIEDLQEGLLEGVDPAELEEGDDDMRTVSWPQGEVTSYNLVTEAVDAGEEGSGERSDDWAQLVPTMDITERCPAHLLEITHEELQELAEEVHLEHSRPLTDSALEIITEVAEDEPNAERFSDLAGALSELMLLAVADADFTHAAQVIGTLHGMAAERGIDATTFLPDPEDLLAQASASIRHSPEADTSALPEFIAHLGPRAVDPVCNLLHDQDLEFLQPLLASGLSLLASQNLPRIQRRLQDATGSAARHILAAVASSPYPEANRVLALAAGHKEPRVRQQAIKSLVGRKALDKPEARKCLAMALEDKDPQVRAAAILALKEHPTEEIGTQLLGIIQGPRFKSMPQPERHVYFETLVRLPGDGARKTLRDWATKPVWWPNAERLERRKLAAKVLARSIHPEDRELLTRNKNSPFPGIRKACREALVNSPTLADMAAANKRADQSPAGESK